MRRGWPILLSLLVAIAAFASPAWAERRLAIVVGIDAYDNLKADQQLRKAVNDAKAVGDALAALGFDVLRGENLRRLEFNRLWQRFLNEIAPGDVVAFFFAGHGVELAGSNFLLARDVPQVVSGEDELLKGESIGLARLLEDIRGRKPKISLLILDACRDNPFPQAGRSVGATRGLARVEAPEGTFVMFSAGTGEAALDRLGDTDADTNSVYTRRLVPLMRQRGLSLPDLAQEVRRQVREVAAGIRHRQTPAYYDEVVGRFCLAGCEGDAVVAALPGSPAADKPPIAPPAPGIQAPHEALPADLPIRPEVLRVIETHPFFANAPPVRVGNYQINTIISSTTTGGGIGQVSSDSDFNESMTVKWLRQGLVTLNQVQRYTVNNNGAVGTYGTKSETVSALNGLISLSYKMSTTVGPRSSTTSRLSSLENLNGHVFPISVGNRFSYDSAFQWSSSAAAAGGSSSKSACEVTRRYDARVFHPRLTGAAYLLVCDDRTVEKKNGEAKHSQSRDLFFDALGIWLRVDPVDPSDQIVMKDETVLTGKYTTVSNGSYTLKSFLLAR